MRLLLCAALGLMLSAFGSHTAPSYFLSHHPDDTTSRQLRHYPVVIGDPNQPEAVAGAMWYKSYLDHQLGGVTTPRMLKRELAKLRFADFVKP